MFNNSSIVSSIEFDKNQEFFAIAGVTKRIKIYDYNVVLKVTSDYLGYFTKGCISGHGGHPLPHHRDGLLEQDLVHLLEQLPQVHAGQQRL